MARRAAASSLQRVRAAAFKAPRCSVNPCTKYIVSRAIIILRLAPHTMQLTRKAPELLASDNTRALQLVTDLKAIGSILGSGECCACARAQNCSSQRGIAEDRAAYYALGVVARQILDRVTDITAPDQARACSQQRVIIMTASRSPSSLRIRSPTKPSASNASATFSQCLNRPVSASSYARERNEKKSASSLMT